jgi:hypothetical protein
VCERERELKIKIWGGAWGPWGLGGRGGLRAGGPGRPGGRGDTCKARVGPTSI